MPARLSPDQTAFFKQQGYLLYDRPVFAPEKFERLKRHFEEQLPLWQATAGKGKTPEAMDVPHFSDLALFEWLLADEVLDLVEPLLGPDIMLWSSHFICKPAGTGKRVPWHEDSAYWGNRLDPMEVVTVWLAVDPSTSENGCMRVIPGTHGNGYSDYDPVEAPEKHVFHREIRRGRFDESKAVDCLLKPNTCSFHHAKTIHGSNYNTSAIRRCGYTMRYAPASSKFTPGAGGNNLHQVYLARGKDRAGNVYGDPAKVHRAWVEASAAERKAVKTLAH
ncbi:MAG: phytanoyl-CoA dioxygenase family protein [Planctomycetota bacterium]|nr:phytanoyl-CoA dioxygenase family protein [Planctomycetota bacterium]